MEDNPPILNRYGSYYKFVNYRESATMLLDILKASAGTVTTTKNLEYINLGSDPTHSSFDLSFLSAVPSAEKPK